MSDAIIIALIGGICTAVPSLIATIVINNKSTAVMQYKIDDLTKKVEKHNKVVERTYVMEEQIKVVNHRLKDLEEQEKEGK